ncbi:hypothetical protein BH09SUM1_BH09SUM1_28480 [soil metagenome]
MSSTGNFENEPQEAPHGWDPVADRDPRWTTIARLAREADSPVFPPPSMFEAVQMETRRQLRAEGLLREDAPRTAASHDPGFFAWMRLVLLGGGAGGQLIRIGAVAALAFVVGSNLQTSEPESTGANRFIASAPAPQSVLVQQQTVPVSNAALAQGERVYPSYLDSTEQSAASSDWRSTASNRNAWVYENPSMARTVSLAGAPVGTYGEARPDLASQALDQLQVLKFYSLVDRDDRSLAEIRRVEQTLSQLRSEVNWDDSAQSVALESYRRGEQALAAKRYHDAQTAFEGVIDRAPGSSLAFLAHFQIGRLAYENTQDYALALEAFRKCLANYPAPFLTDQHKSYLQERIQILSESVADNWKSVGYWQAAERATGGDGAVAPLLKVIESGASPRLVANSAMRLRDILAADSGRQEIDPVPVVNALRDRVERSNAGADAARVEFALGEILARRLMDRPGAQDAYARALTLSPDEATRLLIVSRLSARGETPITGPETPNQ